MKKLYVIPYYPVGTILEFDREMDMTAIYGGTWELFGTGRMTIGIDESDPDFNEALKLGGSKTHAQTVDEMASHSHNAKTGVGKVASTYRVVQGTYASGNAGNKSSNHAPATPTNVSWYYDVPTNGNEIPGGNHYHDVTVGSAGKGNPMDVINPYVVVYRYRKIADDDTQLANANGGGGTKM